VLNSTVHFHVATFVLLALIAQNLAPLAEQNPTQHAPLHRHYRNCQPRPSQGRKVPSRSSLPTANALRLRYFFPNQRICNLRKRTRALSAFGESKGPKGLDVFDRCATAGAFSYSQAGTLDPSMMSKRVRSGSTATVWCSHLPSFPNPHPPSHSREREFFFC